MRIDFWLLAVCSTLLVLLAFRLGLTAGRIETRAASQAHEQRLQAAAREAGFAAARCVGGFKITAEAP
jgi:hypothetical protein